jgi:hypothetical protein
VLSQVRPVREGPKVRVGSGLTNTVDRGYLVPCRAFRVSSVEVRRDLITAFLNGLEIGKQGVGDSL